MTARHRAAALSAAFLAAAVPAFADGGVLAGRLSEVEMAVSPADPAVTETTPASFVGGSPPQPASHESAAVAPASLTPPPAAAPASAEAAGAPSAARLVDSYIAPRLANLSRAALALQNGVLRACGAGTNDAGRYVEQALDEAVVAAAAAAGVQTIRPEAADVAVEVLVPVADTEASRSRFDAISRGSLPAPRSLRDLAQEHPGLAGLPAVEQLLPRIAVVSTRDRCALALAAAANVRLAAQRREAAFRAGLVAPAWDPAAPTDALADRQRLRDLVEALLLALDRTDRDFTRFALSPRSNRALPFLSAARMQLLLAAEADALLDHLALIRDVPGAGADVAAVAAEIAAGLVKARDTLRRPGEAGRARRETALAAFDGAQDAALARLPQAFGLDPAALHRPLAAYGTRTPPD